MTVQETIQNDWSAEPAMMDACLTLVDRLRAAGVRDHYTLGVLRDLTGSRSDAVLARAAMYLTSAKVGILGTCLLYEVNGQFIEVDHQQSDAYASGESLIHPESGVPMREEDLFVVFVPGAAFVADQK